MKDIFKRMIKDFEDNGERTTRVIDFDQEASMEQKKREGYF